MAGSANHFSTDWSFPDPDIVSDTLNLIDKIFLMTDYAIYTFAQLLAHLNRSRESISFSSSVLHESRSIDDHDGCRHETEEA